ncbi:MAG: hypothetical protein J6B89_00425 [Bacilli bacterium]|nr:hypothetical protein [Bacilli bacterium]
MKMKNRIARYKQISNYILSTDKFKVIFLLMIVLVLYGGFVLGTNVNNFFDTILVNYQFSFFNIFFFSLLLCNTLNTCSVFDELKFYIIRLKDKKTYLKEMILINIVQNVIFIGLFLILYFSVLILLKFGMFDVYNYNSYEISNFLYSIFYLVRYILISLFISIIISILNFKYKKGISRVVIVLFLIGFFVFSELGIDNFLIFELLPYGYLGGVSFDRFLSEVIWSGSYVLFLLLLIFLLFRVSRRKVYIHRYLLFNDISYLFKNRLKFLVPLLFAPALILLILNRNFNVEFGDVLLSVFGNNITFNNNSVIEYIMCLFNVVSFIFIGLDLFIKDIKNEIDYIFLRMNSDTWYKNKFLFLMIIDFVIKIIQYLLVLLVVLLIKGNISREVFNILLLDVFNILFYQLVVLMCYFSLAVNKKLRLLIFAMSILIVIFIPKSLMIFKSYLILFIGLSVMMYILLSIIIKKNKRKVLLLGGV